ncbi:MAG TPA: hypothetical protein VN812_01150 [Candidatus Acidoferrales bacterium]|nr:hypothetical protein [Candidatus Acidoferrales bacterium]
MEYLAVTLFFAVTAGHLLCAPWWLQRRWGQRFASSEELFFHSVVIGVGTLQAVLHLLACTIGISLAAGLVALVLLDSAIVAWQMVSRSSPDNLTSPLEVTQPAAASHPLKANRSQRASKSHKAHDRRRDQTEPTGGTSWWATALGVPWLSLLGATAVAACVLSWLTRAAQSFQILGIDSYHYHVPYAVNYAHGSNLFGYLATPHLYPVGASILGAWFFQPFSDALLLDLTNLLPYLLLLACLVYLFRLLTDEPGWEWATIIFLLLFTGKMFRASVFISADLFYCATFAALFTELCSIWIRNGAEVFDWLTLALATGMLFSSKIQGLMSAVLLIGFFKVAVAGRLARGRAQLARLMPSIRLLALCIGLLLASGGVWLVRNWLYFGSPMAPAGLRVFGITIFSGQATSSDWLSIAKDMRDNPGYNLASRFLARSGEWVGVWPAFLSVGLLALLVDVIHQLVTRRRVTAVVQRKLFALGLFVALFAVHSYILVYTEGTSIEILYGQTLRYIIPFFALYPLLVYACFFSDTLPWVKRLHLNWVVLLPALGYLLWNYNVLTEMPAGWNRMYGREDLLDYRMLPLALLMVAPWFLGLKGAGQRAARYGCTAVVAVYLIVFCQNTVTVHDRLMHDDLIRFERDFFRFETTGSAKTKYRGVLYRVIDYERQHQLDCIRRRFFTMSRFDFPLDLQDPGFNNLVFDVQDSNTRIGRLLRADGPGHRACDYIVTVFRDAAEGETQYAAVNEAAIGSALEIRGSLETLGDSDRYRVYRVNSQ